MLTAFRWADVAASSIIVLLLATMGGFYVAHTKKNGHVAIARVEQQGSSPLTGKSVMEMGYWNVQRWAARLVGLGVTPNQLSMISLLFGVLAGFAAAFGGLGICAVALGLSGFCDLFDGLVARARGIASDSGEVIDVLADRYAEISVYIGILIFYRGSLVLQIIAMVALEGSGMVTYASAKVEALRASVPASLMRRHERMMYLIAAAWLSGFSLPIERHAGWGSGTAVPLIGGLVIIAMVANYAAVRRMRMLARVLASTPPA